MNQLMTKNLACEWAKDNIRTNCVAPGQIKTPLEQPEATAKHAARIPLGRFGGQTGPRRSLTSLLVK